MDTAACCVVVRCHPYKQFMQCLTKYGFVKIPFGWPLLLGGLLCMRERSSFFILTDSYPGKQILRWIGAKIEIALGRLMPRRMCPAGVAGFPSAGRARRRG